MNDPSEETNYLIIHDHLKQVYIYNRNWDAFGWTLASH